MSWKITMKPEPEDEDPGTGDKMGDLIMWHRIGHLLVKLGAAAAALAFITALIALFVHGFTLPDYTKKVCIALVILGIISIIGGKLAINDVIRDPDWR